MKLWSLLLILGTSILFSSCSNYITQMHREFDRHDGIKPPPERDKFALYRQNQMSQQYSKKPLITSESNPYVVPSVKRNYENPSAPAKRYKAQDLADNRGDGSLWSGQEGRDNFLFTKNDKKGNGDIVLIKVAGKLKNEITAELKRAFPTPVKTDKKEEGGEKEAAKEPASAAAATSAEDSKVDASTDKVYDRISSVIIEQINEDHLLLRGRKNVLYKNRKRVVEVQALVARRDILTDDTINSNQILESQVSVVR